jgi:hypothetical protein
MPLICLQIKLIQMSTVIRTHILANAMNLSIEINILLLDK